MNGAQKVFPEGQLSNPVTDLAGNCQCLLKVLDGLARITQLKVVTSQVVQRRAIYRSITGLARHRQRFLVEIDGALSVAQPAVCLAQVVCGGAHQRLVIPGVSRLQC